MKQTNLTISGLIALSAIGLLVTLSSCENLSTNRNSTATASENVDQGLSSGSQGYFILDKGRKSF